MKRTGSQTRKKSFALPGQLDLFGAEKIANTQNPANDPLAQIPAKRAGIISAVAAGSATQTKMAKIDAPARTPPPAAANSNAPEKHPRGRPRKLTPPVTTATPVKTEPARDPHAQLRDEWWNSQMVCVFLKISRKTLWERRRAKDLNFPQPKLMGGARNLYRASAIREWAETMADAEF